MTGKSVSCPLCASPLFEEALVVENVPVHIGVAWPSADDAVRAPTARLALAVCQRCSFVWNTAFDPSNLAYSPGYDVALDHSATYVRYLEHEVDRLVVTRQIRRRTVLEVGCGNGRFLNLLCEAGGNDGVGFDPALREPTATTTANYRVVLLAEEFHRSIAPAIRSPALIVLRSVLELVWDPTEMLRQLRDVDDLADLYVEVPNAAWLFNEGHVWNVHYEHCNYFTSDTLSLALVAGGFESLLCEPCYVDGQYLRADGRAGSREVAPAKCSSKDVDEATESLVALNRLRTERVADWSERLVSYAIAGRRVAVWGAGGRGATFCHAVDEALGGVLPVDFAIDVNPRRHSAYLPGCALPIVPPTWLLDHPVDVVLLTNDTYEAEVRAAIEKMGVSADVIVVH
jgi:hypothetical protein